uniref:NADH dehydrogenase subunit 3 n=1 Tax=Palaemon tenuidactylus TaxID=1440500 RepID=UPI0023D86D0E|nr:NADH dehydrogenase subunit 3 [Palaemon tenuidactylus]YP_010758738.1 NADH dehydrogenase subunit 3 [Palaemon macrodactylus]WDD39107.1 NADH dehydrogenase subunit 3 [Palaemon tenuidactylus]WEW73445.1 NADH dehydrogenase subunit 3 [Palaemon macrodactylus]
MLIMLMMILFTLILSTIVMFISSILAKKTITDREKCSPFECGFDPKGAGRLPFSLRFFLIAIIFLIFDVEITLLFPLVKTFKATLTETWIITGTFFLLILLIGLYHEWNQGALDWST